jgi:hypothetical protein
MIDMLVLFVCSLIGACREGTDRYGDQGLERRVWNQTDEPKAIIPEICQDVTRFDLDDRPRNIDGRRANGSAHPIALPFDPTPRQSLVVTPGRGLTYLVTWSLSGHESRADNGREGRELEHGN